MYMLSGEGSGFDSQFLHNYSSDDDYQLLPSLDTSPQVWGWFSQLLLRHSGICSLFDLRTLLSSTKDEEALTLHGMLAVRRQTM
jgi:hypothetical protein